MSLDWTDNTESDLSEYGVYRHTSDVAASAVKIAEVRASRFVDTTSANATPTTVAASELQEDILREVAPAAAGYGLLTNPSFERADQSDTDRPTAGLAAI